MKKENVMKSLETVIKSNPKAFEFNCDTYADKYGADCFIIINLDRDGAVISYRIMFYDDIDDIIVESQKDKNGKFYFCDYVCGKNHYHHFVTEK